MDVRCEKCNTEYELDEARLKPGGVTVKCTTCGHMFKIRKRSPTQSGPAPKPVTNPPPSGPVSATRPAPLPRSMSQATPVKGVPLPPSARAQTGSGPVTAGEGDRNWVIRLDNGETRTCRELGMLQQWIITGMVSRESMISRSGKTWKRLGDIAELASFFVVAEEARVQRAARDSGSLTPPRMSAPSPERETVVEPMRGPGTGRNVAPPPPPRPPTAPPPPPRSTVMGPAAAPPRQPSATPPPPPQAPPRPLASPGAPTLLVSPPMAAANDQGVAGARTVPAIPGAMGGIPSFSPPSSAPLPPPPSAMPAPEQRSTGAWATEDVKPMHEDGDAGPRRGAVRSTGPGEGFGGVVRQVPTTDAAFVGGLGAANASGGFRRGDGADDDDFEQPRRRGAGMWIALGSLVVIAAAGAVVYFAVLRPAPAGSVAPVVSDGGLVAVAADAGAPVEAPVDAKAASAADDLLDQARVQLGRDSSAALAAAEKLLADGGRNDAASLGMRARLVSAQVQILEDEADLARDSKTADKVRREGKQLVLTALGLAQRAIKAGSGDAMANVAMADVLRLQNKPLKDLRRYLDTARQAAPGDREAGLVEALTALRDKDFTRAGELLRGLDQGALAGTGDVRPRWHLARLAHAQKQSDDARSAADAVIAAQPEHAGARALLAKLGTVAVDPMPPGDDPVDAGTGTGPGTGSGPGTGAGPGTSAPVGNDYDKLLAKANKLAEVDCGQAMPYFQRALEVQPNGVEALSGMGFCHIDAKQFSSAHSKFRAALGISPRFERALWGVAEAYQQQGRSDLAITAYEKYLEVYPNSAAAQRQLDRLKGKSVGPTPPEGGGDGTGGGTAPSGDPPPDKPPETKPEPGPSTDPSTSP